MINIFVEITRCGILNKFNFIITVVINIRPKILRKKKISDENNSDVLDFRRYLYDVKSTFINKKRTLF